MRATFILALILILSPCCKGFAVPLEAVPGPAVHSNGSTSIPSGVTQGAPPAPTPAELVAASSVPGGDPLLGAATPEPLAPKIPAFPVQMYVRMGTTSHFELFFLNVKYGYALSDFQFYDAWCLKRGAPLPGHTIHTVRLYDSLAPNLPPHYAHMPWHKINYLINHKDGASKEAIQQAIWRMVRCRCSLVGRGARRLIREANLKGADYKPGPGDLGAIILEPVIREQPLFIEYKIPQNVPPAVKAAVFPPLPVPTVGGFASRLFIPPFFYWPSGGGGVTTVKPSVPEPSSVVLLVIGILGILLPWKMRKWLTGCPCIARSGGRIAELPADRWDGS